MAGPVLDVDRCVLPSSMPVRPAAAACRAVIADAMPRIVTTVEAEDVGRLERLADRRWLRPGDVVAGLPRGADRPLA